MKVNSILETIGNTPHLKINKLYPSKANVWIKLERANPGGSIKDRIALSMVEDAEHRGILKKNSMIIEPTSGNTGIGLAMVAAVKGYKLILVMPESMSIERRRILCAYGATLELTPREKGMKGAIDRANELAAKNAGRIAVQAAINRIFIPFDIESEPPSTPMQVGRITAERGERRAPPPLFKRKPQIPPERALMTPHGIRERPQRSAAYAPLRHTLLQSTLSPTPCGQFVLQLSAC